MNQMSLLENFGIFTNILKHPEEIKEIKFKTVLSTLDSILLLSDYIWHINGTCEFFTLIFLGIIFLYMNGKYFLIWIDI